MLGTLIILILSSVIYISDNLWSLGSFKQIPAESYHKQCVSKFGQNLSK